MARIPENEIERLKNEVSVERLIESSGIELKKTGKDLAGKCPFHEDRIKGARLELLPGFEALIIPTHPGLACHRHCLISLAACL
jgi:CHC2 zinc finger